MVMELPLLTRVMAAAEDAGMDLGDLSDTQLVMLWQNARRITDFAQQEIDYRYQTRRVRGED